MEIGKMIAFFFINNNLIIIPICTHTRKDRYYACTHVYMWGDGVLYV